MRGLIYIFLLFYSFTWSQDKAYQLFTSKGKKTSFEKLSNKILKADIVLFGEIHNNPISHWLELELVKELSQRKSITIGAEMFQTNDQNNIQQYLKGKINDIQLDSLVDLWYNYKTDYAPILQFAKVRNIKCIATNIPQQYATLVYKKGLESLDTLPKNEKAFIAPLPIPFDPQLPKYKEILSMLGDHGTPELVMAQAIKDATMAHFILLNHVKKETFIHFNGSYHSDDYEGILWYLKKESPNLNYITITTVTQESLKKLSKENKNKADYIICVDSDMTTTY